MLPNLSGLSLDEHTAFVDRSVIPTDAKRDGGGGGGSNSSKQSRLFRTKMESEPGKNLTHANLDANGTFAEYLDEGEARWDRAGTFVDAINQGASAWFRAMTTWTNSRTFENVGQFFDATDIAIGKGYWNELPEQAKEAILGRFDPKDDNGRRNLVMVNKRKAEAETAVNGLSIASSKKPQLTKYVQFFMMVAKQGIQTVGQNDLRWAWTGSGFGLWAKLVTKDGLELNKIAYDRVGSWFPGVERSMSKGFSHPIVKYEKSGELKTHHDQIPPLELLTKLKKHGGKSTEEWVREHGLQMLTHVKGGRFTSGATYGIFPMNPQILRCLMQDLYDNPQKWWGNEVNKANGYWSATTGPYDFPWEKKADIIDALLKEKMASPPSLRVVSIEPGSGRDDRYNRPFIVAFPVGFPHGGLKTNDSEVRFSLTVPVHLGKPMSQGAREITTRFLKDVATVADEGAEPNEAVAASDRIMLMNPLHDGSTHRGLSVALDLVRSSKLAKHMKDSGTHPSAEQGWFHHMAPSPQDVTNYLAYLGQVGGNTETDEESDGAEDEGSGESDGDAEMPEGIDGVEDEVLRKSGGDAEMPEGSDAVEEEEYGQQVVPPSPDDAGFVLEDDEVAAWWKDQAADRNDSGVVLDGAASSPGPPPYSPAATEIQESPPNSPAATEIQESPPNSPAYTEIQESSGAVNVIVNGIMVPLGPLGRHSDEKKKEYLGEIYKKMLVKDIRVLTLHGIWALLLALGWKDVENRSKKTSSVPDPGEWVLLQASQSKATKAELETFKGDALRDLTTLEEATSLYNIISTLQNGHLFPKSQWVGFVKFSRVLTYEKASKPESWGSKGTSGWWHRSQNELAWVIDAAIPMLPEAPDTRMAPPGGLSLAKVSVRLESPPWQEYKLYNGKDLNGEDLYNDLKTRVSQELMRLFAASL